MSKIQEKISGGVGLKSDDEIEESSISLDYTRIKDEKKPYTEIQIENVTNDINKEFEDISQTKIQIKGNDKKTIGIIVCIIAFVIVIGGTLIVLNYNKKLKERYKPQVSKPEVEDTLEIHTTDEDWNEDTIDSANDRDWDPDPYNSWDPTDSGWGY